MMKTNTNVNKAKKEKNDEYYTLYDDIRKELINYKSFLKGKKIYCNCDSNESNFVKFLNEVKDEWEIDCVWNTWIHQDGTRGFQSEESIKLLKQCDVVITNPPFSLFREFINLIMEHNKKFIVISSTTSYTYKQIFPKILSNEIQFGFNPVKQFLAPDGKIHKFGNICWFTNFPINKNNNFLVTNVKYNEQNYIKFDNFDAINVNKIIDIPDDFYGAMGVPLLFAENLNRTQFEILGLSNTSKENLPKNISLNKTASYINGKKTYAKLFIKRILSIK